mgnify:CR=1 FL=1
MVPTYGRHCLPLELPFRETTARAAEIRPLEKTPGVPAMALRGRHARAGIGELGCGRRRRVCG